MNILVTGAAGFIGSQLCKRFLMEGHSIVGVDNINDYYDTSLKKDRLVNLQYHNNFTFNKLDISERPELDMLFSNFSFDYVVHLAAQVGVRSSFNEPSSYIQSNLLGYSNILECCRQVKIKHLIYASSSSVYGLNSKIPFSTIDPVDHPVSLYAATKRSNELMSHTYSYLYVLPTTGLRFFTVYGPWGRPDMSLFKFTKSILSGVPIDIYNQGEMKRDFTYIDDIIEGIVRICKIIPKSNPYWTVTPASSSAPYQIYNIGHGNPVNLMDYIAMLEQVLGIKAIKNFMPMQAGDVYQTYADTTDLFTVTGYRPKVDLETGIKKFICWYRDYYHR